MRGQRQIVVVGGVAAGLAAASRARRLDPAARVIVLEKGGDVSYGACGLALNLGDPNRSMEDLAVFTPARLASERGLDVRLHHEAMEIDARRREVRVACAGAERAIPFDGLIIATGSRARCPAWAARRPEGMFFLRTLEDGRRLKRALAERGARRAVVVGGGHIGIGVAEALAVRGLGVTLVCRGNALPPEAPVEVSGAVSAGLNRAGIEIVAGAEALAVEGEDRVRALETTAARLPADLVVVAVGFEPETELARRSGLRLAADGTIAVDERLRTSMDGVFASGDCAGSYHRLLRRAVFAPRGNTARRQGRLAGENACGGEAVFPGVVGTALMAACGLEVGRAGIDEAQAAALGFAPRSVAIRHRTRGMKTVGGGEIFVRLVFDGASGKILGGWLAGPEGVAGRLNVLAAALAAGWTLADLEALDAGYTPALSPVDDPLSLAAHEGSK